MYFMLLDPTARRIRDPRPALPLTHFDPGLGHMFARTDWGANASWFTYQLGWSRIDHQHADGNMFQLWRKGEWLTKERSGYGLQIACSDYKNALALENDAPDHNAPGDYGNFEWKRGSQWTYVNDGRREDRRLGRPIRNTSTRSVTRRRSIARRTRWRRM